MALVLIPLPDRDFDPTEAAVPWLALTRRGHQVRFATPSGRAAEADPRMLRGTGLGLWKKLLMADRRGRSAYEAMSACDDFRRPRSYQNAGAEECDGIILPGGHAPGMRQYLESESVQAMVARAFERNIPVGAICHGVLVAARTRSAAGRSVLHGRKTTALTRVLELSGWILTSLWLGDYYRTYPLPVETEVKAALAAPGDFVAGPPAVLRDDPGHLRRGFAVRDGNYVSARWPGDAHRFAAEFVSLLEERTGAQTVERAA